MVWSSSHLLCHSWLAVDFEELKAITLCTCYSVRNGEKKGNDLQQLKWLSHKFYPNESGRKCLVWDSLANNDDFQEREKKQHIRKIK